MDTDSLSNRLTGSGEVRGHFPSRSDGRIVRANMEFPYRLHIYHSDILNQCHRAPGGSDPHREDASEHWACQHHDLDSGGLRWICIFPLLWFMCYFKPSSLFSSFSFLPGFFSDFYFPWLLYLSLHLLFFFSFCCMPQTPEVSLK